MCLLKDIGILILWIGTGWVAMLFFSLLAHIMPPLLALILAFLFWLGLVHLTIAPCGK